ncbi:hypothetical protein AB2L27_05020 [Kineococcus sp. LSe6-4]|uniref:Uncharacterized protein n=1 Tax=Kineococcus halophytocola TaxID=3234027 RepID=A0ABV4GXV5_9ACTN
MRLGPSGPRLPWSTAAGVRRARDRRLLGLRGLPVTAGWRVEGNLVEVSTRFPVPNVLLAEHAHAELALTGPFAGRTAYVASVLARPADTGRRGVRRARDEVFLLTSVEAVGAATEFVVGFSGAGAPVPFRGSPDQLAVLEAALRAAGPDPAVRPQDFLAVGDTSVSLVGPWPEDRRAGADRVVPARLRLLAGLADALGRGGL